MARVEGMSTDRELFCWIAQQINGQCAKGVFQLLRAFVQILTVHEFLAVKENGTLTVTHNQQEQITF